MKCPTCGSLQFYAKDPDDEYEEVRFSLRGDEVVPDPADAASLKITPQTEAFCERCAWHGRLAELEK
jgi:hypothetical protein